MYSTRCEASAAELSLYAYRTKVQWTALEIRGTENINFSGMHYATIMCFLCFFFFFDVFYCKFNN